MKGMASTARQFRCYCPVELSTLGKYLRLSLRLNEAQQK
jgi:hypothetical protein